MNALNYLITASWQGKTAVKAATTDIGGLSGAGKKANQGLADVKAGLDMTRDAFAKTGKVISTFYGALKEGAELEAEAEMYDNLAASIGTTGDALLDKLIPATKGMVENAELVRGASDLISLGLADTQDEVVRWSTAVSSLNLDLQVLGLTLANDSTARLDSLGLGMDTVNKKTAKFVALGYEAGEAFDLAVLEALEERMVLLGDASETTAGKIQRAEVAVANLQDKAKLFLANRWEPIVSGLVDVTDEWAGAQADVDEALKRGLITQVQANNLVIDAAMGFERRRDLLHETREAVQMLIAEEERQAQVLEDGQAWMVAYTTSRTAYNKSMNASTAGYETYTNALIGAELQQKAFTASQEAGRKEMEAQRVLAEAARAEFSNLTMTISNAKSPVSEIVDAQRELDAAYGEWVTTVTDNSYEISQINQQLFADLNTDQRDAYEEILATVDEGGAEWLAAYDALQGDLTSSQRAALIAQAADFQSANGAIGSAYTGNAQDAEAAQARIDAANAAIAQSYRETAVDILEARLAQTIEEDGLGAATAMIQFQEALGLITPAEAAALQEVATKTQLITDTTNTMLDTYMQDGVLTQEEIANLATAVALVGENSNLTKDEIIELSDVGNEKFVRLGTDANNFETDVRNANIETGKLKDLIIDGLPNRKDIDIYITTHGSVPAGLSDGATPATPDGYRAAGGPVWPGGAFVVGERGPEMFVPRSAGTIVPNGGGGNTTIINNNNTREAAALAMAHAEHIRRARMDAI